MREMKTTFNHKITLLAFLFNYNVCNSCVENYLYKIYDNIKGKEENL